MYIVHNEHVHVMYTQTDLLITLPDGPQVMNVKLRLHILLAVVGNERHFKRMIAHEIECFSDLGHCRGGLGVVGCPSTTSAGGPRLLGETQRLQREGREVEGMKGEERRGGRGGKRRRGRERGNV